MSEAFWPSVEIAAAIVVVSVPVMWLVAILAAKVLRWPSRKTVERWERRAQRNPNADGPMTPMLFTVLVLGLALPLNVGVVLLPHFSETDGPTPVAGVLAGTTVVLALSIPTGLWWRRSRPRERTTVRPARPAPPPGTPVWTGDRDGYRIEVRAKRLSMAGLTWLVLLGVVIGAAILVTPLIALQAETGIALGRREIVLVGLLVGIPFAGAFLFALRRNIATYRVEISSRGVRVASDRESFEWTWTQVDRLTLRTDSDYARVGVRSRLRGDLTLMIGVMNRGRGTAELPYRLRALVVDQGFTERHPPANAPGLHRFTSADG
ncbi:hypothetical protein [Myceligenerans pegani]|uniref:DUF304 domain-containing protein n=1 Tax=Myceligenerans pegani TaxID=2776917 RepID=A0ABR9N432_9MICO|nr:hypothetical protein [Myceligenerans sp. TRM 65318]MBE1878427.1 hypothetical protein [Myceligenerans sp. TRM 65318]MBE3020698.1 hypothetical protein [Myceligenerans sp. TRM 65318]